MEREQERDEYHAKILQLEGLVRDRDRKDGVTQRLRTEVCPVAVASFTKVTYLAYMFLCHIYMQVLGLPCFTVALSGGFFILRFNMFYFAFFLWRCFHI